MHTHVAARTVWSLMQSSACQSGSRHHTAFPSITKRLTVCGDGMRPGLGPELRGTPQTSFSSSCPHCASRLSPPLLLERGDGAQGRQSQSDGACSLELRELEKHQALVPCSARTYWASHAASSHSKMDLGGRFHCSHTASHCNPKPTGTL